MKTFLAIVIFCLPALGQAVYPGRGSYLGPATFAASNSCAAPNYCAYNGVDVIPGGTPPGLSNSDGTNNGATVYDTSFLGHKNFDGSTFGSSANLSPITRLTDANSAGVACNAYSAGAGGSGAGTLTNTNTSLVGIGCNGTEHIGLFNPTGPNRGHFTPIHSGAFITGDLCVTGCVSGSSSVVENFGSIVFSYTDPSTLFAFGPNSDISALTTVCPYSINTATGAYSLLTCIVDFKYGLPQYSAPQWSAATHYSWGAYVIHPLSTSEMATGGAWTTGHSYTLGDIVVAQGGAIACMYVLKTASGAATTGSSPSFVSSPPCKIDTLPDGAGNVWRGTSSTAQFVYQNTGITGTSGSSFQITGHPDLLSTFNDGANIVWTNVGPAYIPGSAGTAFWAGLKSSSNDATYSANGSLYPSKYAMAMSTDTYGCGTGVCSSVGYGKWTADQGSGKDVVVYDATANAFQQLDTATGIWTTFTCGTGNGFTCGSITASTVGGAPLTTISNPNGGGACPYVIHDSQMNKLATAPHLQISEQGGYLGANCPSQNFQVWNATPSAFNAASSLQVTYSGLNHSTMDQTELVAFTGTASGGSNSGWFNSIYNLSAGVSSQPGTSVYLLPGNPPPATYPLGCNSVSGSPTCNLGLALDSHLSCAGGCDHGSFHSCGTTYNYANLGPAFNAWQNMETCWPTSNPTTTPTITFGPVSQFTHTFATGTSKTFNAQFQISEWSQDGNWLFWSSDWGCNLGVVSGASTPAVWSSGTYYQQLIVPPVPANPIALCGYPWASGTSYSVGNLINPIEGTTGSGSIDDVFQAITAGTSGPNSSIGGNQPVCLQYVGGASGQTASCFAGTNPPATTAATVTAASESGTTGTIAVSTALALNVGTQVTLAGFSPSGWNGIFPVTGAVGADCPGTNCGTVTSFQLAGLPPGLSAVTTFGAAASEGDTVCDSPSDNGSGSVNSFNPSSCSGGVLWQDLGPQTQRGDVFAVNLGNQH
jgi:hypothetical protein